MKRNLIIGALIVLAALGAVYFFGFASRKPAPDMVVKTLQGETVQLSKLRGKVVLINFWATSCATCIKEMPSLTALYREWQPKGLELVAVAMQYDPPNYVLHYAQSNKLPFKVALDIEGKAAQAFGGVLGTPTTYVVDPQGRIHKRYLGEPDWAELKDWLGKTLAE